ncbi:MAG: hypothetical protein ABIJ08_07155, partial [Nanoarchaeota archaeon]
MKRRTTLLAMGATCAAGYAVGKFGLLELLWNFFSGLFIASTPNYHFADNIDSIKDVQNFLAIEPDGIFGPQTRYALETVLL